MERPVLSVEGKEIRKIDLDDAVFGREVSDGSVYHAIRNELANRRVGTASTKGRSEVRGSGKKPWRQKGTGRARSGTKRSPVWVGGGTVFGPKPRSYAYSLPRKVKRRAMMSILSLKTQNDALSVVEDFDIESGKTKDFVGVIKNLSEGDKTVVILGDEAPMIRRAGRNVPWVSFLSYNRLRAHDLYYGKRVLVLESAAKKLGEFYGNGGE